MTKRVSLVAMMAMLLAVGLKADNYAYLVTASDQLGTIDLDSGVFTQIGNTGVLLSGLGVAQGALYGTEYGGSMLYQVNLADGSLTMVGNSGITYYLTGSTVRGLYAIDDNNNLYSVDPASGAVTLIGSTGVVLRGSTDGISTNSRTLYLTVGSNLYVLNTTTGAATLVGDTGLSGTGAMVFGGGKLYAGPNSPFQIDTLNTATGLGTFVSYPSGNPAPTHFWGLAARHRNLRAPALSWGWARVCRDHPAETALKNA